MARNRRKAYRKKVAAKKQRKAFCAKGGSWLRSKDSTEAERKLGALRLRMDCGGGMKKGYRYTEEQKAAMQADREAKAAAKGTPTRRTVRFFKGMPQPSGRHIRFGASGRHIRFS